MRHTLTALLLTLTFWAQASETIRWTSPENYRLSAELYPAGAKAVVFIHGTGGPDVRERIYADALNSAGITVLAVDFKTGIYRDGRDRGQHQFIPMLRSAMDQLRARGYKDIGVMGTSLGGVVTVRSKMASAGVNARSYVALYPNCSLYLEGGWWPNTTREPVAPGPIMILYGEQDEQPERTACPQMEARTQHWSAQYIVYGPAHHGFDRPGATWRVPEPSSPTGSLTLQYHEAAAQDAKQRIVRFFKETL